MLSGMSSINETMMVNLHKEAAAIAPVSDLQNAVIGLSVTVALLSLIIVIFILLVTLRYAKYKYTNHAVYGVASPSWHISSKDIKLFSCNIQPLQSSDSVSLCSQAPMLMFSNESDKMTSGKPTRTDFGFYKGQPVCLKKYTLTEMSVDKHIEREFELLANMHHENLAGFYGICMKPNEVLLVTQYCIKGSLEEILLFEPVHLDEQFIASLIIDIVKGMTYLHKISGLHIHGNLKSSNCLVTGRWVVKLSDFGLINMRSKLRENRDFMWSAPEVISQKELATQKADVYSFGIILYELIGKQGPFGKSYSYTDEDMQALLSRICEDFYHPETSWLCCEDYLKNIMLACWHPSPKLRPDFPSLNQQLKPLRAILNGRSIVDNMLIMMERYQMRLEDLVEEKTSQLTREKKKTENLLHRMLPPQVAEQLLSGRPVIPESFSCITVFFSDICDFTCLASTATPIQVIQLLNTLYTLFDSIIKNYDVYKVETVGDAYLCVSGLPRPNGDNHAVEICLMALEMVKALKSFKMAKVLSEQRPMQIRIGVHSGQCVAGVVGVSMPRYTLFGDTINVASRLETTSEPMKIQISSQTKDLLDKTGGFVCQKRGLVNLKGKGEMVTFWLEGAKPAFCRHNSALPSVTSEHKLLSVPGVVSSLDSCSSNSSRHSSFTSEPGIDLLQVPTLSRTRSRSDSMKSHNSSDLLSRAHSFRQKIKSESLSAAHVSDENVHMPSLSKIASVPTNSINESHRLLRPHSDCGLQPSATLNNVIIQVDHY